MNTATMPNKPVSDAALLHQFTAHGDQAAFAQIVAKYQRLVFASAIRRTRDAHLAEDITQAAFILLSQRAGRIGADVPLAGWLHRAAGYAASNANRMKRRRQQHESLAAQQRSEQSIEPIARWNEIEPLLDGLVDRMSAADRAAIVGRFVQELSIEEIAATLGTGVEAAKKRIQRALEKLRRLLGGNGIAISATALGAILTDRCPATHVAPPGNLTNTIMQSLAATNTPAAAIAKGVSTMLFWKQFKITATILFITALVMSGAGFALNRALAGDDSSPRSAPAQPLASREFLDIMEINLLDDHDCLDLDTGKKLTNNLRVRTREEGRVWWRESGADAHCETTSPDEECGLYGMGVAWLLADNSAIAEMSADELDRQLASAGEPQWDNLMPAAGELPVTYLYKTKDGGMGIVQYVAMAKKDSPALKVKLKIVKK